MIWIILLGALFLRLININQSLWMDEAIAGVIARDLSWAAVFTQYFPLDNHPPLFVLLIKLLFTFLPANEMVMRLPSVITGVLTVYVLYLLTKKLLGLKIATTVALLLATSPLHIYYSQEARTYPYNTLLVVSLMWGFINYISSHQKRYLVFYALLGTLLLYMDYLPALIFLTTNILVLVYKQFRKDWLVANLIIALSFIFWLPYFLRQLTLGTSTRNLSGVFDAVLGKFSITALPQTIEKFILGRVQVTWDGSLIIIVLPVTFVCCLALWGIWKGKRREVYLLGAWLFIPIVIGYLLSLFIPVFLYFRFLFVLPAFIILVGMGIEASGARWKNLALSVVLLINLVALFKYYFDENLQREQWRDAVSWVIEKYQPQDIVLFASSDPFAPYLWYGQSKLPATGAFGQFYAKEEDLAKLEGLILNKERVYLFTYLQDITDPERRLQRWILEDGFSKAYAKPFIGVGSIDVYER